MRDLAAERPPEFPKMILPREKKLLEQILETSLGATRKKAKVTAGKKPKTAQPKRPAKPRTGVKPR